MILIADLEVDVGQVEAIEQYGMLEREKEKSRKEGRKLRTEETVKKIQANVDITRIHETELTKRAQAINKSLVAVVNESDEILNALDSNFYIKEKITKKGRQVIKMSPMKLMVLLSILGPVADNTKLQLAGSYCQTLVPLLIEHTEHMSRVSSASNMNFNTSSLGGDNPGITYPKWFEEWYMEKYGEQPPYGGGDRDDELPPLTLEEQKRQARINELRELIALYERQMKGWKEQYNDYVQRTGLTKAEQATKVRLANTIAEVTLILAELYAELTELLGKKTEEKKEDEEEEEDFYEDDISKSEAQKEYDKLVQEMKDIVNAGGSTTSEQKRRIAELKIILGI